VAEKRASAPAEEGVFERRFGGVEVAADGEEFEARVGEVLEEDGNFGLWCVDRPNPA